MKTLQKFLTLFLAGSALLGICAFQASLPPAQAAVTPTPTYDPLIEPILPENPTELELGTNLYWHWCMPCHGDVGQGLTDEFRGIWESDHQNCWGRGCHAGHNGDMGFPIPTVVPAIVIENKLAQFPSLQALTDYLNATHPPQHPGILEAQEYHAIASYVFTMNERTLEEATPTTTPPPLPSPTASLVPAKQPSSTSDADPASLFVIGLVLLLGVVVVVAIRKPKP